MIWDRLLNQFSNKSWGSFLQWVQIHLNTTKDIDIAETTDEQGNIHFCQICLLLFGCWTVTQGKKHKAKVFLCSSRLKGWAVRRFLGRSSRMRRLKPITIRSLPAFPADIAHMVPPTVTMSWQGPGRKRPVFCAKLCINGTRPNNMADCLFATLSARKLNYDRTPFHCICENQQNDIALN